MSRSYFTSFLTNNNMINEKLTVQKLDNGHKGMQYVNCNTGER